MTDKSTEAPIFQTTEASVDTPSDAGMEKGNENLNLNGGGKTFGLSGNALKIIAATSMLIDHIGVIIFPEVVFLRILGRFAFPIYAYMISEGCTYTKNKLRYFLSLFILGFLCQATYFIYGGGIDLCILVTFSLSILTIYALQYAKEQFFAKNALPIKRFLSVLSLFALVIGTYILNRYVYMDYGFWGYLTPVFISLFKMPSSAPNWLKSLDNRFIRLVMLGIGLVLISLESAPIEFFSLLSLPLLLLYSRKRGRRKMKYFFYIFYPLHLVVLEGIRALLYYFGF